MLTYLLDLDLGVTPLDSPGHPVVAVPDVVPAIELVDDGRGAPGRLAGDVSDLGRIEVILGGDHLVQAHRYHRHFPVRFFLKLLGAEGY